MEAGEAQELKENAERGAEKALRPVAFTMSVLAVLVAVATVLGHRTHTEAILNQAKASDIWNEYQAKKIRYHDTELANELLSVATLADENAAKKIEKKHADYLSKSDDDVEGLKGKAEGFVTKVEEAEERANRFDLAETLLEIGLVITSVTLLTRSRIYWYFGIAFALGGIASALSVLFLK